MNQKTKPKNTIVGLKDLRENMDSYITRVKAGESLTIMRRSEVVFRITPADSDEENNWETIVDFTELNPNGVNAKTVLESLRSNHG